MQETHEIGLDSIVHIVQNLSPAQRAEVAKAIGRLDGTPAPAPAPPARHRRWFLLEVPRPVVAPF
jgi:hypothetical protein